MAMSGSRHQDGELFAACLTTAPVPLVCARTDLELTRDVFEDFRRRYLAGLRRTTGISEVAKQHGEAEPAMIAVPRANQIEIVAIQRVMTHDLPFVPRRSEQSRPLFIGEQPQSGHWMAPMDPGMGESGGTPVHQTAVWRPRPRASGNTA